MNKKIILSLSTMMILSASAFAGNQYYIKHKGGTDVRTSQLSPLKTINIVVKKIMLLNLSEKQRETITKIVMSPNTQKAINPFDAFSKNEFNEDKFLEALKQNKDDTVEFRVSKLQKIYNTLSAEQKKDLRTIFDMDRVMLKKPHNS